MSIGVGIFGPPLDQAFLPGDTVELPNGYRGKVDRVMREKRDGRWYQVIVSFPMRHVVMEREDRLTRVCAGKTV